jgi:hypothetical protein
MKKYTITLKHDNGKINITTMASDELTAIAKVMLMENCPKSAIIKIKVTK